MKNDRRTFLKNLVVLGVAAPSAALASQHRQSPLTGLLLSSHPDRAKLFMHSLNANTSIQWQLETTPNSATGTLETARKAFKRHQPSVMVALGDGMAQQLEPLANEYGVPIIAAEFGVRMSSTQHPYVLTQSLELWRASWALGTYSAKHYGTNTVIVSTTLESGYDLPQAFAGGLQASGGTVSEWLFLEKRNPNRSPDALIAKIRSLKPDSVHVISSDATGTAFLQAFAQSGLNIPVTTSSLAFDAQQTPSFAGQFKTASTFSGDSAVQALAQGIAGRLNQAFAQSSELAGVLHALREQQRKASTPEIHLRNWHDTSRKLELLSVHDYAALTQGAKFQAGNNSPYCV